MRLWFVHIRTAIIAPMCFRHSTRTRVGDTKLVISQLSKRLLTESPESQPVSSTSDARDISDELSVDDTDIQDSYPYPSDALRNQLKRNAAASFLKMQTVLHVSTVEHSY